MSWRGTFMKDFWRSVAPRQDFISRFLASDASRRFVCEELILFLSCVEKWNPKSLYPHVQNDGTEPSSKELSIHCILEIMCRARPYFLHSMLYGVSSVQEGICDCRDLRKWTSWTCLQKSSCVVSGDSDNWETVIHLPSRIKWGPWTYLPRGGSEI